MTDGVKAFSAAVLTCLLILTAVDSLPLIDPACPPLQNEKGDAKNGENLPKYYPNYCATFVTSAAGIIHRNREDFSAVSTLWVALFTAVLAVFTISLARSTGELVSDAKKTSKRQLRAYVGVDETKISLNRTRLRGKIIVKNFGQTPATNVRHWLGVVIRPHPLREALPPSEQPTRHMSYLGSGGSFVLPFEREFTSPELAIVHSKRFRFHVFGAISYEDVFGDTWSTEYSMTYGGPDAVSNALIWRANNHDPDRA